MASQSQQHPATMDHLPDEILSNIFIRLLAKQLAQMRCLSKSWNTLLSQPSFIKSHLNRSIKHNDPVLLVFNELFLSNKPFTAHPSRNPRRELTNFIKIPVVSPSEFGAGILIGSINGLILIDTFREIHLPDSIPESSGNRWNYLGVLAGKLCVMSSIKDGVIEVWVLMDRVAESWVKRHVFSQFSGNGIIIPFGFTLHNEFLFENLDDCRLSLYDPLAAKVKLFKKIDKGGDIITRVVEYVDSLVWVAPAKCDISCCNISRLKV